MYVHLALPCCGLHNYEEHNIFFLQAQLVKGGFRNVYMNTVTGVHQSVVKVLLLVVY